MDDSNQHTYGQLQAIIRAIPRHDKAEYLAALELAPNLVATESDPLRFLRSSGMNPTAAARQLVNYWKRRRKVFRERAFLPLLDLSGTGALHDDDAVEFIKTGMFAFLPRDEAGRTVVCLDTSRRLEDSTDLSLQATFYICHVIAENPISQTDGFVLLFLVRDDPKLDAATQQALSLLLNTFPIKAHCFHLFNCVPSWSSTSPPLHDFVGHMVSMFEYIFKQHQVYIHNTDEKDALLQTLASYGLHKATLPPCLGGSWRYDRFMRWLLKRITRDQLKQSNPTKQNTKRSANSSDEGTESTFDQSANEDAKLPANPPTKSGDDESNASHDNDEPSRDEIYAVARRQLQKAIAQLSVEEKAEYTEALQKASSEIWEEECRVDSFLCVEILNARLAAKRIARYWQLRSNSFGSKQYDRMHQTGEAALERRELTALGSGFLKLLPNDTEGCPVLFIDSSLLQRGATKETIHRCLFYMFSLMAENEMAQTAGAVLLHKMYSPQDERIDSLYLERLNLSLPIRFKAIHMLSHCQPSSETVSRAKLIAERHFIHVAPCVDSLAYRLEAFGFTKATLPKGLNGEWSYSKFIQWQEVRTRMEWRIPMGFRGRDNSECYDFPSIRPYEVLPESQKAEGKRRANVIHCRRKRDRVRIDTGDLQEQVTELEAEQETLRKDNSRLESLIKAAEEAVANAMVQDTANAGSMTLTTLPSNLRQQQQVVDPAAAVMASNQPHWVQQSQAITPRFAAVNPATVPTASNQSNAGQQPQGIALRPTLAFSALSQLQSTPLQQQEIAVTSAFSDPTGMLAVLDQARLRQQHQQQQQEAIASALLHHLLGTSTTRTAVPLATTALPGSLASFLVQQEHQRVVREASPVTFLPQQPGGNNLAFQQRLQQEQAAGRLGLSAGSLLPRNPLIGVAPTIRPTSSLETSTAEGLLALQQQLGANWRCVRTGQDGDERDNPDPPDDSSSLEHR